MHGIGTGFVVQRTYDLIADCVVFFIRKTGEVCGGVGDFIDRKIHRRAAVYRREADEHSVSVGCNALEIGGNDAVFAVGQCFVGNDAIEITGGFALCFDCEAEILPNALAIVGNRAFVVARFVIFERNGAFFHAGFGKERFCGFHIAGRYKLLAGILAEFLFAVGIIDTERNNTFCSLGLAAGQRIDMVTVKCDRKSLAHTGVREKLACGVKEICINRRDRVLRDLACSVDGFGFGTAQVQIENILVLEAFQLFFGGVALRKKRDELIGLYNLIHRIVFVCTDVVVVQVALQLKGFCGDLAVFERTVGKRHTEGGGSIPGVIDVVGIVKLGGVVFAKRHECRACQTAQKVLDVGKFRFKGDLQYIVLDGAHAEIVDRAKPFLDAACVLDRIQERGGGVILGRREQSLPSVDKIVGIDDDTVAPAAVL